MFEELTCTCRDCDRALAADALRITYENDDGQRRAYECACGTVTITVVR